MRNVAGAMTAALLMAAAGVAAAQGAIPASPAQETNMSIPNGYTAHASVDLGGRMVNTSGSGAMYNTLVNQRTGPRVLGQTFEMHAMPGKKGMLTDDLKVFTTGFGGDPYNYAKLDASKSKVYEFSGIFRRDRLYSDYDLLANPNLPGGLSISNMVNGVAVPALAWSQVKRSPVMFNIVRRMTDTNLTLRPFDAFTYRFAYSHSTMEGPTLSPSYTILKYNALLRQWERNGSDDYTGHSTGSLRRQPRSPLRCRRITISQTRPSCSIPVHSRFRKRMERLPISATLPALRLTATLPFPVPVIRPAWAADTQARPTTRSSLLRTSPAVCRSSIRLAPW